MSLRQTVLVTGLVAVVAASSSEASTIRRLHRDGPQTLQPVAIALRPASTPAAPVAIAPPTDNTPAASASRRTTPSASTQVQRLGPAQAAQRRAPARPVIKARDVNIMRRADNRDNDQLLATAAVNVLDSAADLDRRVDVTGPNAGCVADRNADAQLNELDVYAYLDSYFAGAAAADLNANNQVTVQDLFDFIVAFLAGCDARPLTPTDGRPDPSTTDSPTPDSRTAAGR